MDQAASDLHQRRLAEAIASNSHTLPAVLAPGAQPPDMREALKDVPPLVTFEPQSLLDFAGALLPEPQWAVDDIWPRGASGIIGGRPKDKKSTMAVELAISLATGTPMFGLPQFPSRQRASVLYVQQELEPARPARRAEHPRRTWAR